MPVDEAYLKFRRERHHGREQRVQRSTRLRTGRWRAFCEGNEEKKSECDWQVEALTRGEAAFARHVHVLGVQA